MKTFELAEIISVPMVTFHPPKWFGLENEGSHLKFSISSHDT